MKPSDPEFEQLQCPSQSLIRGGEVLQEKWLLLIVDRLIKGPAGFNDLARKTDLVNVTTLSQRLGRFEREGLVVKTIHSTMPPRTSYRLTPAGEALKPIIEAIAEWSGHVSNLPTRGIFAKMRKAVRRRPEAPRDN